MNDDFSRQIFTGFYRIVLTVNESILARNKM